MPENNINHHCTICGNGYYYCKSCQHINSFTSWRAVADTTQHYKIYLLLHDYICGYADKEKTKEQLKHIDLTGLETFIPEVQGKIKEILT